MAGGAPGITLNFNSSAAQQLNQMRQTASIAKKEMQQIERAWKKLDKAGLARDPASLARYKELERAFQSAKGTISHEKEEREFYDEQTHDAHMAERVTGRVLGTLRTVNNVLAGNAGFKDIVRQVVADDRTIARIASSFGANAKTIGLLRGAGLVGAAALEGWEIGTAIRERVEQRTEEINKANEEVARGKMSASLAQQLGGNKDWWTRNVAVGMGLDNGEKNFKSMGDFAEALSGANAQDIGSALVAFHRNKSLDANDSQRNATSILGLGGLLWGSRRKQVNQAEDMRLGQELARDINEGIREEQRKQHTTKLDEDTLKRIREDAAVGFVKMHGLDDEAAKLLKEAVNRRTQKVQTPDESYWEHELKMENEARLSIRGKRIPASLVD